MLLDASTRPLDAKRKAATTFVAARKSRVMPINALRVNDGRRESSRLVCKLQNRDYAFNRDPTFLDAYSPVDRLWLADEDERRQRFDDDDEQFTSKRAVCNLIRRLYAAL